MKIRQFHPVIAFALASFLLPAPSSKADEVLSTYGNISDYWRPATVTSVVLQANSFTTSASPGGWLLNSVTINIDAVNNPSGNFVLSIYDTAGGNVGTIGAEIATLVGSSNPDVGNNTYTAGGLSLNSSSTYWLVAGVSSGSGSYSWNYYNSDIFSTAGDWSILTDSTSATWNLPSASFQVYYGYPFVFSVDATAVVPEPSTFAMAMSAFAAVALVRRRKRAKVA